jgi:hypothetical protein
MKTVSALGITIGLVTLATVVHAGGILASPAIYGAYNQSQASCTVVNVGDRPILVEVGIFDESGSPLPTNDNCTNGIGPEGYCSVSASGISSAGAFACSATVRSGSARSLRGTFLLTDDSYSVLRQAALR